MAIWERQWRGLAVWLLWPLTGCVLGSVRQVQVGALGPYEDARGVAVEVTGEAPEALERELRDSLQRAVERQAGQPEAASGAPLRLVVHVEEARAPQAASSSASSRALEQASTALGLTGLDALESGRLVLQGHLLAPEGEERLGRVRWEAAGDPVALASRAGREAGEALGRRMAYRRGDFVHRRAADERLFLTPTALTLDAGSFVVSNDQLLMFRAGVGLGRRVQLDVWAGGLALPVATGVPLFFVHVVGGAGALGLGVVGAADVGLKVRLLDESRHLPGLAVSYDFLNVFGGAIGAGGAVVIGGKGGGGLAVAGAGGANLQFNLFSAVAGKHFGNLHVTAGVWVLDNHHLIPQRAVIRVTGVGKDGTGDVDQDLTLERLPTVAQPFLGMQYVLGPRSALGVELFPRAPVHESFGTTGVRWQLGADAPRGPLALDRMRVRIDLAALWVLAPPSEDGSRPRLPLPVPWLGLGLYQL